ncbi:hypothetical protein A0H81_13818 [Grifola frondosa]|uniref:Uncharacterized protein n=1 Tax=Grifola frondosa TaxID=5627 RepID=A0A1C7LNH9_GRIFR|nr:hypothetical protein A0H81_13818 [Grifola frondosa]
MQADIRTRVKGKAAHLPTMKGNSLRASATLITAHLLDQHTPLLIADHATPVDVFKNSSLPAAVSAARANHAHSIPIMSPLPSCGNSPVQQNHSMPHTSQIRIDPTADANHSCPNPVPASRADILELREDIQEVGRNLGRFADAIMTLVSKESLPQHRNDREKGTNVTAMDVDDEGSEGDVDDTIPSSPRRHPRKAAAIPRHRSEDSITLSKDVQRHARLLMDRESPDSAFDPKYMATREEVLAFDPSRGYCCTADNFRPDLVSPPGTPWNKSVAKVFVRSFLDEDIYLCSDPDLITAAFRSHLKYLRKVFDKRENLSDLEIVFHKRVAKRTERKRNLFYRRFEVAANHSDLRRHLRILQDLGIDGMSSDESEHENGVTQYRVLVKPWRNPLLTPWLRIFDAAYRQDRLNGCNQSTRGAQPHLRLASQKVDYSRPAVSHLPANAYNLKWLKSLSQFDLESLSPKRLEYDFSHTPSMMEMAQSYNGDHHKSRRYV